MATQGMVGNYNTNSLSQLAAVESSIPLIRQAIDIVDVSSSNNLIIIADYGSSHGRNSIFAMKKLIEFLKESNKTKDNHQILIIHNDLPSNNWLQFFKTLEEDKSYFGVACGRSFYEQCFPNNSVTIGYSSTSLHWLSQKPCNLSNHCFSYFCQGEEYEAFRHQAQLDYRSFLKYRSCELIPGGVLILVILCVDDQGVSGFEKAKDLLYKCARTLPLTEQELIDYTIPVHFLSYSDYLDNDLFNECSLELIKADFGSIKSPHAILFEENQITLDEFAHYRTEYMRSWTQPSLEQVIHSNEQLLNKFWTMYECEVKDKPQEHMNYSFRTYLVLKKKLKS